MTPSIAALPALNRSLVMAHVQAQTFFPVGDDPFGEHDVGSLELAGVGRIFWKIDYYADAAVSSGSEDPSDMAKCFRVLTVMLAVEY